jgi:hypothetical protein
MKTVNLLPDWYLNEHRQKKRLALHFALMLALGGAMLTWHMMGRNETTRLLAQRDQLARQAATLVDPTADIAKAEAEKRRLENLQVAFRELGNTIPMSAVVQQVINDMTTGMSLSRVVVEVRQQAVKGSGFVGDVKNPPKYHDVAYLTVVGVAPNDVQIAQLIGKISSNVLFNDVSLNYTRTELLRDYNVRRFEIQMNMDLERLTSEDPAAETKVDQKAAVTVGGRNEG